MEDYTGRDKVALKLLISSFIVVAAIAVLLAWQQPTQERVEAASSGPEMGLIVSSGSTGCPGGTPASHVCVPGGGSFLLAVEAIAIPAQGYTLMQTYIDYGTDLTYTPGVIATEMASWPDLMVATALRGQDGPGLVNHGGLTGILSPPASTWIGNLIQLDFTCSTVSSSSEVNILIEGDLIAQTSGALFTEHTSNLQIQPKVSSLIIDCIGPTPTPTSTPIPPTATPTVSPTPTNTPTPLPPPSERPDVKVAKIDLEDPVDSAAQYSYRITVESIGLQTAENVVVEDTLPAGAVFKKATSADATCSHDSGVVTCTVTNPMAPSDEVTIDVEVAAPSPESDTLVSNLVTVESSNEPFANTGNNKDIEQTLVLAPRSDVTLEKVGEPTFLKAGENVTYTLIARNLGPNTAENVQIVDTLPPNAAFVSASNPECGAPSGGEVTCNIGTLAVSGEAAVQIVLTAPIVTRNELLKNSAVISADNELLSQTGNNLAIENTPVVAPPPDVTISKSDSADPVLRLGYYSYDITVKNEGLGDALDVVVVDALPVASVFSYQKFFLGSTFISSVGAACGSISITEVECVLGDMDVGQQVLITINLRAPTTLIDQTITNNATVSAANPDEIPSGNSASETTALKACFDIDGDLLVDLPNDILGVILVSGLRVGDDGYDVIFDFDGGGLIDLPFDVLGTIEHYDQDCSLLL